ncbi:branched-chain amino acid ABC transporter permease [Stigmatella erecta]|uniref:Amino acid/amide ABC transporter membrane protein 2, HAAT family n=1 Tax=Stigmatella erecta TaxID=83460 RepID=A0A1I0KJN5_9BACT|nr:branched-chain amino acid ABC transporter permease [Stigmatella erecta]SEU24978.1 amino acid/amide ABC transporter membrane protein 2, HAAT family [Stigmatella erecta]
MESSSVPGTVPGVPVALRGILPVLVAVPVLLALEWLLSGSPFAQQLTYRVGVNIVLAVSLNIVNGMTGQFSIGHAGFMAVGAYVSSVLSLNLKEVAISFLPVAVSDQLFFIAALLVGGMAAALCGFLVGLPSLRLRGDYLAIVTLGFGEIIRVFVQNTPLFGRALGLSGIPPATSVMMIGFWVFLTVLVARRIAGSSHGRSLWAIREDEVAAEAMGVNTTGYKVRAFVISSFFAGVAGGLFAHFVQVINPNSFTFVQSMEIVVMVVLGGLGSTTGAIVAAVFLTLLPEGMRSVLPMFTDEGSSLSSRVDQIRMPLYGLLLVALMLLRPQGLFGTKELWEVLPRWLPRRRKGLA